MISDHIEKLLLAYKEEIISETIELIDIPSVSDEIEKTQEALDFYMDLAKGYGFDTFISDDHMVGVVEFGEGDEVIGILVHVDVVNEGDIELWNTNPFEGTYDGEEIIGRGALDNKGPAILMLHVLRALKELNKKTFKKIQLIIGTQEEIYWSDMENYVKKYPLPDYGFSPDSDFPIQNREKGYADFRIIFSDTPNINADNISNPSHTSGMENSVQNNIFEIISISAGKASNSIPDTANAIITGDTTTLFKYLNVFEQKDRISIEQLDNGFSITSKGKACHSSLPEKGMNPIYILSDFLYILPLKQNIYKNMIFFLTEVISNDFYGEKLGCYHESEYEDGEFVHRTTVSPTVISNGPDVYLNLNFRIRFGTSEDDLKKAVLKFGQKYSFKNLEIYSFLDPLMVSKDKPFLQLMADVYEDLTGEKNEFHLDYGTTYAKAMPNMVSWGPTFQEEIEFVKAHIANESISLNSLLHAGTIYGTYLGELIFIEKSYK